MIVGTVCTGIDGELQVRKGRIYEVPTLYNGNWVPPHVRGAFSDFRGLSSHVGGLYSDEGFMRIDVAVLRA